jgi:hypothetical protein
MEQPNYDKKLLKRKWQTKFFKLVKNKNRFIGLCGPNSKGYLRLINNLEFRTIILYDTNAKNLRAVTLQSNLVRFNDNINNSLSVDAFYDLDYCCCISKIEMHLTKIMKIKEFTLTVALREKGGEEKTLNILRKYGRNFMYRVYRESGTPMMILYFPQQTK